MTESRADIDERRASERRKRAARRAHWTGQAYRLGEEPSDNLKDSTTAEERLAMVWPLTVEAWQLAGREHKKEPRSQWPGRLLRPEWMRKSRDE